MMTQQEVLNELFSLDMKGIFSFEALTSLKPLQKSRVTKEPTPAIVLEAQKYICATVSLGNEYAVAVNNRLMKEGKNPDFVPEATYCAPMNDSLILYKHKTKEQFYLRVYPDLCHSFKHEVYIIDSTGQRHGSREFQEKYAEFLPKTAEPDEDYNSQGLARPVMVRNYKVEGIIRLKRGEFEINVKGI